MRLTRAALWLEGADVAVMFAGAVTDKAVFIDAGPWGRLVPAVLDEVFAARTYLEIIVMVSTELGGLETSSPATHVIEDGKVRFDTAFMGVPGNIGGIVGQTLRPDAKVCLRPVDQNALRCHLSWAEGRGVSDIYCCQVLAQSQVCSASIEWHKWAARTY